MWGPDLITFYNDAYRSLLGSSIADGIGMPYPTFRPDVWPSVENQISAALTGRPTTVENVEVITRRNGVPEKAHFTLSCSPVYDEDSSVAGVISYIFETTKTVQARQALEDENVRLRRGLNCLPHMVWSALPDGHHDFYNDVWYEFTGAATGSTDGERWNGMFHPADRERAWAVWRHSLRTGEPYEIQYRLRHKDGDYRWVIGRALPERDNAGIIIRWYGTCTDIHEQVVAQDKLRALQAELTHVSQIAAMGSMAGAFAHEVNQPLAAAANFAAALRIMLENGDSSPEVVKEGLSRVQGAVLRAGDIIRRLRKVVEGQEPHREAVSVGDLVDQTLLLLGDVCGDVHVEVNVADGARLSCDPVQIQQVLTNLIRNACEAVAGQEAPRITIIAGPQGDRFRFSIEDNGPGFDPGTADSLFLPGLRSKKGGMGIGLSITKSIIDAHRGEIAAESLSPHGARVCFNLPIASP
jgi:PAS domain S-box-containing protein